LGANRRPPRRFGHQAARNRAKALLKREWFIASLALLMATPGGYAQGDKARGPDIVAKLTVVMTQPPQHVPSGAVVDGPILGNGDLGIAIGGPPEEQRFYFGKNDFWSQQESPMSVGGLALSIPDLAGASYRQEQDLLNAEVRGTFTKGNLTVRLRTWTAATENLAVTEMSQEGPSAIPVTVQLFPSATKLKDNDKRVNLGREQHGSGRWYFNGLISNVHLYDRVLSEDEIGALKNMKEVENGLVRRWNFDEREGKTPIDTPEKLVQGPDCPNGVVLRPEEWPMDEPSGCTMSPSDGFHYDWLRYLIAPGGNRAPKIMHAYDYIDAGQAPLLKQVTVAAWIYIFSAGDANFILSKGDWDEAYSLQLDQGRLRFNIGDRFVRASSALPTHQWVHVAGTFDGKLLRAFIDGKEVTPGARFLNGAASGGEAWITRNADGPLDQMYPWPDPLPPTATPYTKGREVSFVTRVLGADTTETDDALHFILESGKKVYLVTPVLSDLDNSEHLATAKQRVEGMTVAEIEKLNTAHREWWRQFWSESYVEIGDPLLEKFYYAAQYIAACASRTGKAAPGLYGPWVTTDHPSWNGDYTLDYNYETPVLGLYSSNHLTTASSYEPPVLDFMQRGEQYARTMLNIRGVYYPGHIGPWAKERLTDYDPFMGMKSNAAFSAQPILMRFYSTYDDAYARMVYPFIREVGDFWEDYLKFENGRYVVYDDCAEEVGPWDERPSWATCPYNFNSMNELGFVRATFQGLIDMSKELGVDADHRANWQHILDHLSAFPTGERDGKTVFSRAEGSPATHFQDMFAIWPAGQIGLGSDPKLLEVARNTVATQKISNFPLYAPILARIGYDPQALVKDLRGMATNNAYPNAYIFFEGGGVETVSTIPATVDEMLLQSHQGVLRLFPVWPRDMDARFGNLRAYGAFLVSSELSKGEVKSLVIESEKGKSCTLQNPWRGKEMILYRNGRAAETLTGDTVTFKTTAGERIAVVPR
jgi:hypothetical protein